MKKFRTTLNLEQIASILKGNLEIRFITELNNVSELDEANENSICFYENSSYMDKLKQSKAGLILVPVDFSKDIQQSSNLLFLDTPYVKFMMLVKQWLVMDEHKEENFIHPSATISDSASLGEEIFIGANVVIENNVIIEDHCRIEANCVIKQGSRIHQNCHFFPNVTIYEDTQIGKNVIIHSGCVIGADGFGYHFMNDQQIKIPQIGNVVIGNSVEIGANSTIDRATLGSTLVGEGTKIDNLVQVGHNCKIGKHSILCAQVGLAGNTEVGDFVFLAGQVGAAGHIKIGDRVMVGAQSGIAKSISEGKKFFGTPAVEATLQKRMIVAQQKLPDMMKEWKHWKKKNSSER